VTASQIAAAASGSSTTSASPMASRRAVPAAEVQTSNQASANSSPAPAKASRASGYYTREDLDAILDEYTALLNKYGHRAQDAPPGARLMQLRMFYIPDEPAESPESSGASEP